ncbi:probable WRKY transcription factor protein 1 isoform X1 [Pecten maximus]|uniref:probable WRKY transcription factor protein 1 isoform X1 n=1 Tax=Pecten maximus TaxID=6579 RepID=UPI00145904EC|nr:probable WRKY transcription factor protein 1 isoform X1 [Pecten maximus]
MRYGSPPSVSNDNSGKQAPDQVQVDEGQEFSWFSTDDQHLNSQGHSEDNRQGHTEDNHRLGETDEAHKEEDKIASLESDLILEKARSDMWQKMYTEQKESSESMTCSGNEIVKQFRQLLQNLSVPEDLSEDMKDKWEVVKNQSLDGWQLIMDLASSMTPETTPDENDFQTTQQDDIHKTTSHGNSNPRNNDWGFDKDSGRDEDTDDQNDFSSRSNNKKRSLPKWSETIRDVYNKTKSSMSDVSQQIKETWEQVKNLSQDLWKEHEPSMRKLKEKVSKKVEKVSEKLSTWFTRRRAYANHKRSNYWQSQQKSEEETSSNTGSTKRRSFTAEEEKNNPTTSDNEEEENYDDDDDDDDDQKEWEYSESLVKKYRRQFWKFRTKMDKLSLNKFLQMNFNHWKKAYRKIERFVKKIDLQVLSPPNRKWLTCQRDWWFSICTNVIMDPNCRDVLQGWQVNRTGGNPSNSNGSHDNGPQSKCQRKGDRSRKHCGKNNRGEKRRGDKATGQFPNRQYSTSEQHYQDEKNRRETHKKEEYSDSGNEEIIQDKTRHYCDPNSGDCLTRESSWYMQQLKHRSDMRSMVEQEAELSGDSDWMFTRAEERDFQRTLPDDWYFRKLDSNQYKENDFFDEE